MGVVESVLILLASGACGTLAFYMVKGIVDIFTGRMK